MKNINLGKTLTHLLAVLICVTILVTFGCFCSPYYTITEPYHFVLNPNPMPAHYSLMDVIWLDTQVVTTHFTDMYSNFNINDYVTNMALSFIFGLGTIASCIWYIINEFRRFPTFASGIITQVCSILWALFGLLAYPSNVMLDMGVEKFMGIRTVIVILTIVGAVLVVARFVIWLLTEIQISKERKERLAKL